MQRVLVTILVTALATINACKGVPAASTTPTQPKDAISEAVKQSPQELPEFITRGFTVIEEGDPDPFGCVGKVLMENGEEIGSGVLVAPSAVLTAAHCIQGHEPYWFETNNCERIKIKKAIANPNYIGNLNDIGILMLEEICSETPAIMTEGLQDLTRLEPLLTVGYSFSKKKISNFDTFFYYGTVIEDPSHLKFLPLKSTVWFGDSGGGVFEDGGKLVGIIAYFSIYRGALLEDSATHVFLYKEWIDKTIKENK